MDSKAILRLFKAVQRSVGSFFKSVFPHNLQVLYCTWIDTVTPVAFM